MENFKDQIKKLREEITESTLKMDSVITKLEGLERRFNAPQVEIGKKYRVKFFTITLSVEVLNIQDDEIHYVGLRECEESQEPMEWVTNDYFVIDNNSNFESLEPITEAEWILDVLGAYANWHYESCTHVDRSGLVFGEGSPPIAIASLKDFSHSGHDDSGYYYKGALVMDKNGKWAEGHWPTETKPPVATEDTSLVKKSAFDDMEKIDLLERRFKLLKQIVDELADSLCNDHGFNDGDMYVPINEENNGKVGQCITNLYTLSDLSDSYSEDEFMTDDEFEINKCK